MRAPRPGRWAFHWSMVSGNQPRERPMRLSASGSLWLQGIRRNADSRSKFGQNLDTESAATAERHRCRHSTQLHSFGRAATFSIRYSRAMCGMLDEVALATNVRFDDEKRCGAGCECCRSSPHSR